MALTAQQDQTPGKPQLYKNEPQQFATSLQLSTLTNPQLAAATNADVSTLGN